MESIAQSLRVERDRAEEAGRAKTRFFAAANHDLRQPLQTLRYQVAQLEYLTQTLTVSPEIRRVGASLARSLEDSEKLLEGLLDLSRLDAGAMPVNIQSLDVDSILSAVAAQFRPQAAALGLELVIQLDAVGTEAPVGMPLWVMADRDQLTRVLGNLLNNALRFTHKGRIAVSAWRETGHEGARLGIAGSNGADPTEAMPRIVFRVQDTGTGIAAHELPKIFEEFYQVGNEGRQRGQGLGLGLAIVQRLLARQKGALSLSSTLGAGTCFEVALPAAARAPEDLLPAAQSSAPSLLRPLDARILAVDDDVPLLNSLASMLRLLGSDVCTANGGAAALAVLDTGFRPEILILDHRLGHEKGLELLDRLRTRLGPVPAVLLTGDTTPELAGGAADGRFLVQYKPVNPGRLVALIRAALGVERESQEAE